MNCDECKALVDAFMDNDLDSTHTAGVRTHLAICGPCAKVFEEIAAILDLCGPEAASDIVPPNSQALWCRINNVIENEVRAKRAAEPPPPRRFWPLSFGQLAGAFAFIAVVSSLLTVIAIRNYIQPPPPDVATRSTATQSTFEKVLCKVGLMETPQQAHERRLQQQRAAIDYWNERVQARRTQWDRATREAFDRNLEVIDESVNDYTLILQRDPEDELSGEMLDSVLDDKMNLLRDFSDL